MEKDIKPKCYVVLFVFFQSNLVQILIKCLKEIQLQEFNAINPAHIKTER